MGTASSETRWLNGPVLVATILAGLLFGCAASTPPAPTAAEIPVPPPPPPGDLRIGMCLDYPPLTLQREGKPAGAEVDFATKVGRELKRRTRIVELKREELIPALRDGRIDVIMSGMSITEDRQRLVSFCEPYLHIGQMALIRKADEDKYRDPASIDQKSTRVGFQNYTTSEDFVRSQMTHAKLIGFRSIDQGITALRKRKIDVLIHDAPTIWRVTGGFGSKEKQLAGRFQLLTDESLAWAVRRDDSELLDQLNALVMEWKEDGELDQVLDHWIPVRKKQVPLPGTGPS
jgi:polar amino acid transport system substrate-binding protein